MTTEHTLSGAVAGYRRAQGARAAEVAREGAGRTAALDDRLSEAGLPSGPADPDELDRVPVLSKDSLPGLQEGWGAGERPYSGLLTQGTVAVRAFASPGPIYEPQLPGPDPWGFAPALAACGIGAGDVVLNCFNYHLSPAGMMFDEACRAVGATVVPAGVGMQEVQVRVIADLGVTAYIGLPSYLLALVEAYDAAGLSAQRWRLAKALVTAEPLPAELRAKLTPRVPTVLMAYGTAEAGLIGYEQEPDAGLVPAPGVYVQVCDPATGAPTETGEPGEVVVSVLHPTYPLVRFGTGDVSRWALATDDSAAPRLAGVLGRVGAAVKVRGMFVHPHQASQVLGSLREDGVEGGSFVVGREGDKDLFRLDVVVREGVDLAALPGLVEQRCRDLLRVRPVVHVVDDLGDAPVLVDQRG
jgi:phenylacetate-CoA ligase